MRNFLIGVACGAGVTAFAFHFWPAQKVPLSASIDTGQKSVSPAVPQLSTAVAPIEQAKAQPLDTSKAGLAPATPAALDSAYKPSLPSAAIASLSLSAEHAKMLTPAVNDSRPPTLSELHSQLALQAKDPSWSFDTEQSIRQSLTAGNSSAEFDIVSVECRASLCEVLAFGNLPSSGERWNQVWDGMSKQPWYAGIKGNTTSSVVQNGRYTIVTILQRPKP